MPFIRWAGGKRWLISKIIAQIPNDITNYFEPFLGSGAFFFQIKQLEKVKGNFFLSDINSELINSYKIIRDSCLDLCIELAKHKNNREYYYQLRSSKPETSLHSASKFIYLNRTSFNGIYRVNRNGDFNVPYGNRQYNPLFNFENLKGASSLLKDVSVDTFDFNTILQNVSKGDFVFLDPPYTVAHNNNHFIKYNQPLFSWGDQIRLSCFVKLLNEKKVRFILTNANHSSIINLYEDKFKIFDIERISTVGGSFAKRKPIKELIVTNL